MKLVHQMNLAFGIALVIVLSITAVLIHYVLLDHFMGAQMADLKMMGNTMSATLKASSGPATYEKLPVIASIDSSVNSSTAAIISDTQGNIVEGPLSFTSRPIAPSLKESESFSNLQQIWDGTDERFLVEVNAIPQGTLTLLTPISKIKEIEQALLGRLLLVFCVGGVLMLVLSQLITGKLIKPLMKLKEELAKVKGRKFAKVNLVKAGGEIGSVARTVYEMAGELNRFNRAQKQFFQNASHELKTPLMSIAGYTEGIRDGVFDEEGIRKGLDIILSESGRLSKIVTEMTLLAKLDSEEDVYKPELVCLNELLTEAVERLNPVLVKKNIILHPFFSEQKRMMIHADRDKLLQALLNVVANAIRHANKHIYIYAAMNKGRIEISVSDDGSGIPDDLLPYLFHRFVKGKEGESGLGLAISRAIVERCGGMITANNRKEGGAVFSLGFPLAAAA
ncbi:sensor histidine kinase [Paenibacillus spongiae]|uniref:histidine kinase n=1 Tax=Paenibacillus spongiae TaxID=2909671 RepID=A0ABY5S9R5_9BACL|nr:HAMP domain-containing sensor histidine kinase [Paenibacillus spongiae]UVI30662.1 HAMP domain-containing histidine kinase [Paenibacillus spongiae]